MKAVSCAVWIVVVLLVAATLDAMPDPPAIHPDVSVCKILKAHNCSFDISRPACHSLAIADSALSDLVIRQIGKSNRPIDRLILMAQAGDTSPPALQNTRKLAAIIEAN